MAEQKDIRSAVTTIGRSSGPVGFSSAGRKLCRVYTPAAWQGVLAPPLHPQQWCIFGHRAQCTIETSAVSSRSVGAFLPLTDDHPDQPFAVGSRPRRMPPGPAPRSRAWRRPKCLRALWTPDQPCADWMPPPFRRWTTFSLRLRSGQALRSRLCRATESGSLSVSSLASRMTNSVFVMPTPLMNSGPSGPRTAGIK